MHKVSKYGWDWNVRRTTGYGRCDTMDERIIDEVYNAGWFQIDGLLHYPVESIIDIGAHIGAFSVKAARAYPKAHVLAFEPIKETFELLRENTKDLNVVEFNNPVSGCGMIIDGTNVLFPDMNTGATSMQYRPLLELENKNDYSTIFIKDLISSYGDIDLIKIDCEGGERYIIPELDLSRIGIAIIEFHTGILYGVQMLNLNEFQEFVGLFTRNGFRIHACFELELPNKSF